MYRRDFDDMAAALRAFQSRRKGTYAIADYEALVRQIGQIIGRTAGNFDPDVFLAKCRVLGEG